MAEQGNIIDPRPTPSVGRRGGVALLLMVAALAGAIAGGIATNAFGQAPMLWNDRPFMGGPLDPAQVDQRIERMIKHLAVEADATADQQTKLVAIAKSAAKDLLPLRDKLRANRGQAFDLFTAGSVDRAAIERLRSEQLTLVETASKRISEALGDAAEVLNPEQRRTLVDRVAHFGGWWRWHHG